MPEASNDHSSEATKDIASANRASAMASPQAMPEEAALRLEFLRLFIEQDRHENLSNRMERAKACTDFVLTGKIYMPVLVK